MTVLPYSILVALLIAYPFGCSSLSLQQQQQTGQRERPSPTPITTDSQRRQFLLAGSSFLGVTSANNLLSFSPANAAASTASSNPTTKKKCTDIESCREIGEQKIQEDLQDNPITRLDSGVRYKRLKPGVGAASVQDKDVVDIIYSISRASGAYMYSVGFGFEKVQSGVGVGGSQSDEGIESYRVRLGSRDVPVGVEQALMGMKKGERRRFEVPPSVGFETSEWRPEPITRRGKAQIVDYRTILTGRGTNQPPFPAPTIWDVEVLSFRSSSK